MSVRLLLVELVEQLLGLRRSCLEGRGRGVEG